MELTHTDFTEVTRVVFIEENTVVVLTSGITATSGMLSVLSDTSVTTRDVSPLFASLVCSGRHVFKLQEIKWRSDSVSAIQKQNQFYSPKEARNWILNSIVSAVFTI